MSYLSTFKQMIDTCDYLDCPCTMFTNPESSKIEEDEEWKGIVIEVCKWPRLHKDAAIAVEKGPIWMLILELLNLQNGEQEPVNKLIRIG